MKSKKSPGSEIDEKSDEQKTESSKNPTDDVQVSKVGIETSILGKDENSKEPAEAGKKDEDEDNQRFHNFISEFCKILREEFYSLLMNFQTLSKEGKTTIVNYFYDNMNHYKKMVQEVDNIKKHEITLNKNLLSLEYRTYYDIRKFDLRFYEDVIKEFEKRKAKSGSKIRNPNENIQISKKLISTIMKDSGILKLLFTENYSKMMNFQLWSKKGKKRIINYISADIDRFGQFWKYNEYWKQHVKKLEIDFKNKGSVDPEKKETIDKLAINLRFYGDVMKELEKKMTKASKDFERPILIKLEGQNIDASKLIETLEMLFKSDGKMEKAAEGSEGQILEKIKKSRKIDASKLNETLEKIFGSDRVQSSNSE